MARPSPTGVPHRTTQRLAAVILRRCGWRSIYTPPRAAHGIIIVYPHTSNWDFIIGLLFKFAVGLRANWAGKDTLFRWPLRRLFVRLGGIPVNRRARSGLVGSLLEEFSRRDWMWLALAPEGTRARTDHWKSGFYRLALAGGLPVALGFIDYGTRTVGIDTYLELSGDVERDFAVLRDYYATKRGRRPEQAGDIRLQG
ncbi:MAG: 1-acyl-sn-glycerol-3-phosphate acyltransferase [Proteobacteria bacterium]|nr:1-acyl-sn-glycerol-3-phosphate acyltransferase [Pseudomonadota bacterium]